MTTPNYFKDTARWLWNAYQYILSGEAVESEVRRWLDLGCQALACADRFTETNLTVAERQKLQAALALIKTVLSLFNEHLDNVSRNRPAETIVGAGLSESSVENEVTTDSSPSVTWDEINSAFSNRIRTGVITNRRHLDVKKFLKDVKRKFAV